MVRDSVRSGKQMIRDGKDMKRYGKQKGSDGKQMVADGQTMIKDGYKKLVEDEARGCDGNGPRGWYLECAEKDREHFAEAGFRGLDIEYLQPGNPDRRVHLMYKQFGRGKDEVPPLPREVRLHIGRSLRKSVDADLEFATDATSFEGQP